MISPQEEPEAEGLEGEEKKVAPKATPTKRGRFFIALRGIDIFMLARAEDLSRPAGTEGRSISSWAPPGRYCRLLAHPDSQFIFSYGYRFELYINRLVHKIKTEKISAGVRSQQSANSRFANAAVHAELQLLLSRNLFRNSKVAW